MERNELLALAESPIFRNIDILELHKILTPHNAIIKNYNKGDIICSQEEKLDRLIIVIDGKLKAQMTSTDGKIINMEEFGKYQPVAIPILFSEKNILPVTLYALENSQIFFLSKEMLIKCCMTHKQILENTMAVISSKVSFLSEKIKFLQLNTIKQKIAMTLLRCSKQANSLTFKMKQNKEELSKEMGITRPSLSREFSNLVQEGIIVQEKDIITILNPEKLKNYK
ncbi:MAG: Crp/Fnr family transcriptional regulator [Spirochaetales bacterium]|nr:Crp/Fnr family transcriptional regulator [Spirochaetales bacterium]